MRHVNIAGHMVLGSTTYFPHLTFAYISICQAQHAALQLFTHGHNELRAGLCCLSSCAGLVCTALPGKLALQYPLLFRC